ncbi:hypothetical protein BRD22_06555 [Halobacteriales archaeon SW_8_68_21]|nr:MAG: hypothetical protein BRD22_06555 [Halobacteriales archaeon SW_8_68_21]
MILDTCFLISLEDQEKEAVEKSIILEAKEEEIRIPYVVISELYVGVGKGDHTEKNRKKSERVLTGYDFIEATPDIMRTAGEYEGQIQKQGDDDNDEGIGLGDVIIGATAVHTGEALVTENISDFEKIPDDIEIEPY